MAYSLDSLGRASEDRFPKVDLDTPEGRSQWAHWIWENREMFGIEVGEGTTFGYVDDFAEWRSGGPRRCHGVCSGEYQEVIAVYRESMNRITMYRGSFDPHFDTWYKTPEGRHTSAGFREPMSRRGAAVWSLGHEAAHSRNIDMNIPPDRPHYRAQFYGAQAFRRYRELGGR